MNNTVNLQTIEKKIPMTYVGEKIKTYLKEELGLSTRFVRSAAMSRRIFINGKSVKLDYILREEDMLKIQLETKEHQEIDAEDIPIHIVYEDDAILILNKEPYMVVHPTKSYQSGTLSNAVMHHYKSTGKDTIIRLVSRLDMNTSGLIILAKNQFVHSRISQDMRDDLYEKYYVAIVKGDFPSDTTMIDLPIYRDENGPYQRVVDERGQKSLTEVKVLHRSKGHSLLMLKLLTGRTHQIRVHLSHLGYPIIGDELYGGDLSIIKRQALHAVYLSFRHPVTEEKMNAYAEVLEDFSDAAKVLKLDLSTIRNEIEILKVAES